MSVKISDRDAQQDWPDTRNLNRLFFSD